jgi:hypothetical protein
MSVIGQVESLWRYPVKSMRGQALGEVFVGFSGVYGDRLFAFKSVASPVGFPYFTGREWHEMLLYRPRFRHPEKAARPTNLAEAEEMSPLLNPVAADPADLAVEVETPSGEILAIDDPALEDGVPLRTPTGAGNRSCCAQSRAARIAGLRTAPPSARSSPASQHSGDGGLPGKKIALDLQLTDLPMQIVDHLLRIVDRRRLVATRKQLARTLHQLLLPAADHRRMNPKFHR